MKWPSVKFHKVVLSSVMALSCDTADQADIGLSSYLYTYLFNSQYLGLLASEGRRGALQPFPKLQSPSSAL